MLFFKKKKKTPELPPLPEKLPELPSLPEKKVELPEIPAEAPEKIPEIGEEVKQNTFKSLISEIEKHKELEVPEAEEKKVEIAKKESFVSMSNYGEVLSNINVIRGVLTGTTDSINKALQIKNIRDSEFESWQGSLQDIGKRLMQIDKSLFERVI
jgi:hypothetical protein